MSDKKAEACEMFLVVDGIGDYGCGKTPEAAREDYEATIGDLSDAESFRTVRVLISVPLPVVPTLTGTAPDADGEASLTAIE